MNDKPKKMSIDLPGVPTTAEGRAKERRVTQLGNNDETWAAVEAVIEDRKALRQRVEQLETELAATTAAKSECAKCMISKCHICGEPRDKPGAEFCSAAHARPDILADLTARELLEIAADLQTGYGDDEARIARGHEIAERFERLAKLREKD